MPAHARHARITDRSTHSEHQKRAGRQSSRTHRRRAISDRTRPVRRLHAAAQRRAIRVRAIFHSQHRAGCGGDPDQQDADRTYRGPGRFEGSFFCERLFDMSARDLGIDPAEFRRRNLLREEQLPYPLARVLDVEDSGETECDNGRY
ncbi:MAG: molybdopterin cofactor-binding domain-containing protein, partial [Bradyrhizobium sp.]